MGKKLESNFTNMVVVLFSVTLIASAAVGYVYSLTAGPIEAAKQAKQVNAIREVIPGEFDNDPNADVWKSQTADGGELEAMEKSLLAGEELDEDSKIYLRSHWRQVREFWYDLEQDLLLLSQGLMPYQPLLR